MVVSAEPADPADDELQVNMVADEEAMLVDSGSARSVRPPQIANREAQKHEPCSFTMADGRPLKHHGSTVVSFTSADASM